MSPWAEFPSQRFAAPARLRATTAVLVLTFPAAAAGLALADGWSGPELVSLALVPMALLGVTEAFGRSVGLRFPERSA